MSIQAFGPELSVEAFDERIVGGFSWSREVEDNTLLIGPQIEITRDELRPLIDTNCLGITVLAAHTRSSV